ncbi:MAG: hypothetical protein WDO13_20465 [Verrucomicrobiota bacterium]
MSGNRLAVMFGVAAALFWFIGAYAPAEFLGHFTVFVLACFVGYMVVWNVTPGAAHAADERHQRHQQHHRHRRFGADRASRRIGNCGGASAVRTSGSAGSRWRALR